MALGNLHKPRTSHAHLPELPSLSVVIVSHLHTHALSDATVCNLVVAICGCLCSTASREVSQSEQVGVGVCLFACMIVVVYGVVVLRVGPSRLVVASSSSSSVCGEQ